MRMKWKVRVEKKAKGKNERKKNQVCSWIRRHPNFMGK
jgi:hypothetical protein